MKWPTIHHVLVAAVLGSLCAAGLSQAGELRAWGLDDDDQVTGIPAEDNYIAIAAGDAHGLVAAAGAWHVPAHHAGDCRSAGGGLGW